MIISKELEWLREYVLLGLPYLSKNKKITRIGLWKLGGRCGKKENAAILTNNYRSYRIYIHTWYHPRHAKNAMPYSKIDILGLLAHEMAHTKDLLHSPKHKKLEAKLVSAFMTKLNESGYINEEDELKEYNDITS